MTSGTQTTQFLARVVAWPKDGEATSYVNIHYKGIPKDPSKVRNKDGTSWYGTPGQDLRGVTSNITALTGRGHVRDIYFCTSTQSTAKEYRDPATKRVFKIAERHARTAVALKSLFMDIDLCEGKADKTKGYDTKEELIAAFGAFLKRTHLPFPTIVVFTGGGFHMYWVMEVALVPADWQLLANALAEATRQEGLRCDTACTVDSVRILRVPGTKNFKYDPPRDVKLMSILDRDYEWEELDTPLEPYKVEMPRQLTSQGSMELFPPKKPVANSDLAAGVFNAVSLDQIALGCEFIREAITTGGANFPEPLWNLTTLAAVFSSGGREDAHRMANGHADYAEWTTDQKFDEKVQQQQRNGGGPPFCSTINRVYKGCATCPYLTAGRSPLNLATLIARNSVTQPVAALTPASPLQNSTGWGVTSQSINTPDPDLPDNYFRDPNTGYVMADEVQKDGVISSFPICFYKMELPYLTEGPNTLNFQTVINIGQRPRLIKVEMDTINTAELRKVLQGQGIMVHGSPRALQRIGDFFMAWITKLQATANSVVTPTPFGWKKNGNGYDGFVFGGILHTPNGPAKATPGDLNLSKMYAPTGDRTFWISAAQMITAQKRPELDVILASAFAGPLFALTGHAGALLSAYSPESGVGKTTAMKTAQAVWGDPSIAMQTLTDTNNSVMKKMAELKNIPVYYDELKATTDPKEFANLVYQITGGKTKSRLSANVDQREVGQWNTIMVSSSNQSFIHHLSGTERGTVAGLYRMFEFLVEPMAAHNPGRINMADAQSIVSKTGSNYGVIGMEYAEFLGRDPDAVEKNVKKIYKQIVTTFNIRDEERFWAAIMTTLLVGAEYANMLGFTKIDKQAMLLFLRDRLEDLRVLAGQHAASTQSSDTIVEILSVFLNEKSAEYTLVTNVVHRQSGNPPAGSIVIPPQFPTMRLKSVHVHRGLQDGIIRIGREYLTTYLEKRGQNTTAFIRQLKLRYQALTFRSKLGTGIPEYRTGDMYVIEIDAGKFPELQ